MQTNMIDLMNQQNVLTLNYSFFLLSSSLIYSTAQNITSSKLYDKACVEQSNNSEDQQGCYIWFLESYKEQTTYFSQPYKIYVENNPPQLSQFGCKIMNWFNNTSNQNEYYSTHCYQIQNSDIFKFLQYKDPREIQLFSFEPSSNLILFDNSGKFELSNIYDVLEKIYYFNQEDVNFLKNFTDHSIKATQQTIYSTDLHKFGNIQVANFYDKEINGTSFNFIFNPIYVLDKLLKDQNSLSQAKYKPIFLCMFIQIISNNNLQQKANDVSQYTKTLLLIGGIVQFALIIIYTFIPIYYSFIFNNLIWSPIEKMTQALTRLHKQKSSQNYHFILQQIVQNNKESVFPKEIYNLTISLQQILQILLSLSENYFDNDQADNLIRLSRNIQFFQSSQNYYALGITHNNIGGILTNQGHYIQALEHYQQSIIYAKYEIQLFCQQNPNSHSCQYLKKYCFDDNFSKNNINQQSFKNQLQQSQGINKNQNKVNVLNKIFTYFKVFIFQKQIDVDSQKNINTYEEHNRERIIDIFGNSLIINDQNNRSEQLLSKDENYNQVLQLLMNIYYRKVNYAFTLTYFQTSIDKFQKKINLNGKHKSINNSVVSLNFWKETIQIMKEIYSLIELIGISDHSKIMNLNFQRICYSKLRKQQKIEELTQKINIIIQNNKQQQSKIIEKQEISNINGSNTAQQSLNQNISPIFNEEKNKRSTIREKERLSSEQMKSQFNENSPFIKSHSNKKIQINLRENQESNHQQKENKQQIFFKNENEQKQNKFQQDKVIQDSLKNSFSCSAIDSQFKLQENNYLENQTDRGVQAFFKSDQVKSSLNNQKIVKNNNIHFENKLSSYVKMNEQQMKNQNENSQQNSFESNNNIVKNRIKMKYQKFFNLQKKNQLHFDTNQMAKENMGIITKIMFTDLLIQQQKYLDAALILTDILESSQFFLSHIVYLVYKNLKIIFEHEKIYSKELDEALQSFNKNINFQQIIIYNMSSDHDNWMHTFFMISQLFEKVLNKNQDQYGCIQINQDDFQIREFYRIQPLKQVKPVLPALIDSIKNSFFNQNLNILSENVDSKFYSRDKQLSSNKNSILMQIISLDDQIIGKKQSLLLAKQQLKINNQSKFGNQNNADDSFSNKFRKIQNEQDNDFSNYQNNINLNQYKVKPNDIINYKFEEHLGDNEEPNELIQSSCLQENDDDQCNNNFQQIKQNALFHLSIRKALQQLLKNHKISFEMAKQKYENKKIYLRTSKQCQFKNNRHLNISQKNIIFSTYQICIFKNKLFDELVQVLSQFDVELLIFSMNKGNNFLEKYQDLTFIYNNKAVIRVFYEIEPLINFMVSKRSRFESYPHLTFIQHY